MKRRFFAIFAVLLALMLATCDLIQPTAEDSSSKFTPDGRPMVRLRINVGDNTGGKNTSRALTYDQAHDNVVATGFYEVAFLDSSGIYRYSIPHTVQGDWEVTVPTGVYLGADKAIMLAGIVDGNGDHILLAIGTIAEVVNYDEEEDDYVKAGDISLSLPLPTTAEIKQETFSVTFELEALKSKVGGTPNSFEILGPINGPESTDYLTNNYYSIPMETETATDLVTLYPKFIIPQKGSIDSLQDATDADENDDIIGEYTVTCTTPENFDGLVVASHPTYPTVEYVVGSNLTVQVTLISPAVNTQLSDGAFRFYIDVGSSIAPTHQDVGLTQMFIKVPVYARNNSPGKAIINGVKNNNVAPILWYIQNGVNNSGFDVFGVPESTGGRFLLELVEIDDTETTSMIIDRL